MLDPTDPLVAFGALASLILIGYLGNLVFAKFRFNDTLILILIGVLVGPVLNWVAPDSLAGPARVIGPLALVLILFDGGMALRFADLIHGAARAAILSLLGFALTVGAVAAVVFLILGTPLLSGLVLGAVVGGTSSVVIMPSLAFVRSTRKTDTILALESALTDVLVVVSVFTLVQIAVAQAAVQAQSVAVQVASLFAVSLMLGIIGGLLWIWVVPSIGGKPYGYMLTLGTALALYVASEYLTGQQGGGGPLAVLAFGIVLGNAHGLGKKLRDRMGTQFAEGIRRFQGEIAFIVRTFFFISLGILLDLQQLGNVKILGAGLLVFAALALARYLTVGITTGTVRMQGQSGIQFWMMARGLAAAVMAAVPMARGVPGAADFVAITIVVVVLTNMATTVGGFLYGGPKPDGQDKPPLPTPFEEVTARVVARPTKGPQKR